jgi:hypothetical protein
MGAAVQWNAVIHDLAWPITVLCLAFVFRRQLDEIVARVKRLKHKDTELEFLSKEANESLAKVAHEGFVGAINIEAIYETVKLNEWATLAISRMLMRKGLMALVGTNHVFGLSPSLTELITHCVESRLLSADLAKDLERLREVTYYAEWWKGRVPPRDEWKWAVHNCRRTVQALFDRQPIA